MNISDIIIIYLSFGAPLAAYYFVDNRKSSNKRLLWLKTISTFLVWIPFLMRIIRRKNIIGKLFSFNRFFRSFDDENTEDQLYSFQKRFEAVIRINVAEISIFGFRETFERFAGLTLVQQNPTENRTKSEVFEFTEHNNIALAKICINRRNRNHLSFHQTKAREDFFKLIESLELLPNDLESFNELTHEFFDFLNDETGLAQLVERLSVRNGQTTSVMTVKDTEEHLWKTKTQKPLSASDSPIRLRAKHAIASSIPRKD